jgi:hypothetical protein
MMEEMEEDLVADPQCFTPIFFPQNGQYLTGAP